MSEEQWPSWRLDTTVNGTGITSVTFTIDTYKPTSDVEEAMRQLAAAALWWLDTKQHEEMGLVP